MPDDAAVLQSQNQKLVQQLDAQKQQLHDLELKFQQLKHLQSSYDALVNSFNLLCNEVVDEFAIVGTRGERSENVLRNLDAEEFSQAANWLNIVEASEGDDGIITFQQFISHQHSATRELLIALETMIEDQKAKVSSGSHGLHQNSLAESLQDMISVETQSFHGMMTPLYQKQQEYADKLQTYIQNELLDETEIKRLAGELEESIAELEESRRKLVNLRMQKNAASGAYTPVTGAVNGHISPEKQSDGTVNLQDLKHSIDEAEKLADDRLTELEEAREDNDILMKQLENIENELKDDKYVCTSRVYTLLNDQLHHWKAELSRYKSLTDSLQSERSYLVRREKELEQKIESADTAKAATENAEKRVVELEMQLEKSVIEKNELEFKMEEAAQDSGRKDIKTEFNVMASALSREIGMVEAQLHRWEDIAQEAVSLREEAESEKALLSEKTTEVKALRDKCVQQITEIKSLKELFEKLQKEKFEVQIFVDMLGQGCYDNRDLMEIQESERRACAQADVLKHALNEHDLELRLKAANEAEAACQLRLSAAEAEIADLWVKLDATERDVRELSEAIKLKDAEADAYISEIETIGQAYEDMQTQNMHLLQQMTERDDFNIKLVSESVKTKQAVSALLSEKQALAKQFQLVDSALESVRARISQSEEQLKSVMLEALNSCQEDRRLVLSLETAKWELADAEKELKSLRSSIASSEKEHEQIQRKTAGIQEELEIERNERKKLEEELKEYNKKVEQLITETGEAAVQKLQEEIKECKSILKCGVCFDRPKEVVIVKCFHLFCNQCIQRNLEIRHRKCPGCGTAFGQSDVRFVKI